MEKENLIKIKIQRTNGSDLHPVLMLGRQWSFLEALMSCFAEENIQHRENTFFFCTWSTSLCFQWHIWPKIWKKSVERQKKNVAWFVFFSNLKTKMTISIHTPCSLNVAVLQSNLCVCAVHTTFQVCQISLF